MDAKHLQSIDICSRVLVQNRLAFVCRPTQYAAAIADSFSQPPSDGLAQEALPSISDSAESQPQAVAAQNPQPDPAAAESSAPEFGGAAAEDDDLLQYEDEPVEDLGEKTVMISEMDDELDEENQKPKST